MLCFDKDRYEKDTEKFKAGEISRVRRCFVCECLKCGKKVSVRGENLASGNSTGCGCDMHKKSGETLHKHSLNKYQFDEVLNCWKGYATNTNSVFLFDKDDYDFVKPYCWYETNYGYIMTRLSKTEQVFLHRWILLGNNSKHCDKLVDHINRKPLDCRRNNLRLCEAKQNACNTTVQNNTVSGVLGVSWHEPSKKWRAYICPNHRFISLGYYKRKEDAVKARRAAEIEYFGEFAPR